MHRRAQDSGFAANANDNDAAPDITADALALIEAAAAPIEALDFTQAAKALLIQGRALDLIFNQFVRRSARGNLACHPMHIGLKAQSQCRRALELHLAVQKHLRERTIADADSST